MNANRPRNIDGLPDQFIKSLRMLFDILDEKKTGFIKLTDIQLYWNENEDGLPTGVLESLHQITPRSGKLSFDRFLTGLKIALLKTQSEKSPQKKSHPPNNIYDSDSSTGRRKPNPLNSMNISENVENQRPQNDLSRTSPRKSPTATVYPQQGQKTVLNVPTSRDQNDARNSAINPHQVYKSEKKFVLQGFRRPHDQQQQPHHQQQPQQNLQQPPQQPPRQQPHLNAQQTNQQVQYHSLQRGPNIIKRQRTQSDPTILDSSENRNVSASFDINFPLPGERYMQNKLPSKFFPTPAALRVSQDDNVIRRGGSKLSPTRAADASHQDLGNLQRNSVSEIPFSGSSNQQQTNYYSEPPVVHGRTGSVLSTNSNFVPIHHHQEQQQQDQPGLRERSQSALTTAQEYNKRSSYYSNENLSRPMKPPAPDPNNIRQSYSDSQLRDGKTIYDDSNRRDYNRQQPGAGRRPNSQNTSPVRSPGSQNTSPVHKVAYQKMREPRRHTLQNGVDFNFVKKMKQFEQEKDVLIQGLQTAEKAQNWYKQQIKTVQDRQLALSKNQQLEFPFSIEAQQERMTFQTAQIEEVNQKLIALIRSSEKGFGFHVNLPSPSLAQNELIRQYNQDLSEQASRILKLEQEKSSLIKELFEARAKITPPTDDNTFYD